MGARHIALDDFGDLGLAAVELLRKPEDAGMICLARSESRKIDPICLIGQKAFLKIVLEAPCGLVSVVGVFGEQPINDIRQCFWHGGVFSMSEIGFWARCA